MELKILTLTETEDYRSKDVFSIDGEIIGEGYYGGEPEDNTKGRDYHWVEENIKKIAEKLGATVVTERKEVNNDEFYS